MLQKTKVESRAENKEKPRKIEKLKNSVKKVQNFFTELFQKQVLLATEQLIINKSFT